MPVACQRPRPIRASRPSTELTAARRHRAPALVAAAQQPGHDAVRTRAGRVLEDVGRAWSAAACPCARRSARSTTKQACGGSPGASSKRSAWRSSAGAVGERVQQAALHGLAQRRESGRARPGDAAARCRQAGWPQLHSLTNTTRRPSRDGVMVAVRRKPTWSTTAVIDGSASVTSTAPSRTRLRPLVSVRASKMRPRSSDENGIGHQLKKMSGMRGRSETWVGAAVPAQIGNGR